MTSKTNELDFEEYIVDYLVDNNYVERFNENYSISTCLDIELLISFIKNTQTNKWNYLVKKTGDNAEKEFVKTLHRRLNSKSTIHVLKNELSVFGIRFNLFYSRPYNNLNPDLYDKYNKNIFSVIKELEYEEKTKSNRVDLVIFLNGIPLVTIELKDTFNQGVQDAINQYMYDRDPRELLFKRCLVHFAMSDEKVHMTTKLNGSKTVFLPFNRDITNPDVEDDYRTSYIYREILQKDQLISLINNFIFKEEDKIIFPRYHQLECVNLLLNEATPGRNFLIQHSAGSGKTKTIAWLADGLKNLFDENDERIYDMILVVSDRRVIDGQLQEQVKTIEKKAGVVEVIDENSNQLAESLISGNNIVVTTLHKFSYILDKVQDLPNRKYAIIIDEAHSSQSGSYARNLRTALSNKSLTDDEIDILDDEIDEMILENLEKVRDKSHLSFFGFTATPKNKTFEIFGMKKDNGQYYPSHLYSMKQAIEEGFILDVLKNYITYPTYFKLIKSREDDPEFDSARAKRVLRHFVELHEHSIKEKTSIILDHYMNSTIKKIDGKARAMLVTRGIEAAIKYKLEFDKQIKEQNLPIKTLVAFSGSKTLNTIEYTEKTMNDIKNKKITEAFEDEPYRILIVANKYQTGFDQPLLHTLYVDKQLSGIAAVQTLSRVNRTAKHKEDTCIIDFVNKKETIQKSFQPYYEETFLEEGTSFEKLENLKDEILKYDIYDYETVEEFVKAFYKNAPQQQLHNILNPVIDNYKKKSEDYQTEFKSTLRSFQNHYSFMSQLLPFSDLMLEKIYIFNRYLYRKLPRKNNPLPLTLLQDVDLDSYKIDTSDEGEQIPVIADSGIKSPTEGVLTYKPDEKEKLSDIIEELNEAFKTDFTEEDKVVLKRVKDKLQTNEGLREKIDNNPKSSIEEIFDDYFDEVLSEILTSNFNFFKKINNNEKLKKMLRRKLLDALYEEKNK